MLAKIKTMHVVSFLLFPQMIKLPLFHIKHGKLCIRVINIEESQLQLLYLYSIQNGNVSLEILLIVCEEP